MDANLKTKWVEALRSGEYNQCRGNLKSPDGFCCLGVLAQISGLQFEDRASAHRVVTDDDASTGYRPVSDLIGVKDLSRIWYRNDGAHGLKEPVLREMQVRSE